MGWERWQEDRCQWIFQLKRKIFYKYIWDIIRDIWRLKQIFEMAKIFEKDGVRRMARRPWPIDLSGWEQFCLRAMSTVSWVSYFGHCILCILLCSLHLVCNMYHTLFTTSCVSCVSYFGHCLLSIMLCSLHLVCSGNVYHTLFTTSCVYCVSYFGHCLLCIML